MTTPLPPNLGMNSGKGLGSAGSIASQYGLNFNGNSVGTSGMASLYMGGGQNVYMGRQGTAVNAGLMAGFGGKVPEKLLTAGEVPLDEARNAPLQWTEKQRNEFVSKGLLFKANGFSADMGMPEIMSTWDDLVQSAMAFSKNTGQKWSPWDVLDSYKKKDDFGTVRRGDWLYDARTGEKVKYVGPKTKTTTEKRIDLSSPEDVRAITTQMLTELLGRAPSPEELSKYRTSINGYENANPALATTTQTLNDMGEVTNTSTVTQGGTTDAARQMLITDQAKQGPEYGKFQSATTYYNAMMQMIGG